MSELAERARLIRKQLDSIWYTHEYGPGRGDTVEQLIEQALLAERRLAMEWVDGQLEQCVGVIGMDCNPDVVIAGLRLRLKTHEDVATPRGGE